MMSHKLHYKIGEHLKSIDYKNVKLLFDSACGGDQKIPLFLTDSKSFATKLNEVDLMILKNERIKIIIEIEESSITPPSNNRKDHVLCFSEILYT